MPENLLSLEGEEAHHALSVMRKKEGSIVELINGKNVLAKAEIISTTKRSLRLRVISSLSASPPSSIILCQALIRPNKLDFIMEKGTELGMTELWLFPAERSEKISLSPHQQTRLHALSIAAMKQCGRLDLPTLSLKPPLLQWSSLPYPAYFGETAPHAPPFLSLYKKASGVLFFIGPESGFSPHEEEHLRSLHAQGVRLHPHTLRTETAPLVALTLLSA
ncbi:MAG: 16S rRNA (uracil(1498)-N(3))-methyltransferase [Chlamydiia bacterium]|nr:16S rRNA (uracil(1498)-N(3))-methyltransferase [Chlamydiia bacterium]